MIACRTPAVGIQKATRRRGSGGPASHAFSVSIAAPPRHRAAASGLSFDLELSGHAAACEFHLTIDAAQGDRGAAGADAGAEVIAFELAHHGDVRDIGIDAAIDAGHFDIGIEVVGKLNLDGAVDAVDVNAALAQSPDVDLNPAVDA